MITVDFSQRGDTSLTEYLYQTIKTQILNSTLEPDTKLPSKRALASHLGVSVITTQNAYSQLISEGYIYSIEKKGFFVTDISDFHKPESPAVRDFSPEFSTADKASQSPSELLADFTSNTLNAASFPFTLWSHTMRQVLNSGDEKLLQRSGINGVLELRTAICQYLHDFRNMNISPRQIVIGAGAESLYSILVQFLGRDKKYAVENPGFNKTKQIFELNGADCIPIKIDSQGIDPSLLDESNIQIVHLSPNHHFPTGIVMPVRRRMELLNWVNSSPDRYIIEDDYDSEFRFNGKPLPTLQSLSPQSNIIYMNTFSKTLSPSFRIGYMVLPVNLVQAFETKLSSYSCSVSAFEQHTLARFISEGSFEKHINKMKNYYRSLRNALIVELKKSPLLEFAEIQEQESGLHFLLNVKTDKNPRTLKSELLSGGIRISLLNDYFYDAPENSRTCSFVMNYTALKKDDINKTVNRLYEVICR